MTCRLHNIIEKASWALFLKKMLSSFKCHALNIDISFVIQMEAIPKIKLLTCYIVVNLDYFVVSILTKYEQPVGNNNIVEKL